ncbi:MAG: flavin reductase, partial [Oscillospiraceae bacterium]|nr:flavin reductase [Oscillospiraceae bacterium]
MQFETDIFAQFNKKWALVSAGTKDDYNAMTVSWGGMGTLWGKSVVTVYIKPIRYTWQYMEKNDWFTVSFYPEENRQDLQIMGSRSGRDGDKAALTGLTLKPLENAVTFEQAEVTLVCRKIYRQDLIRDTMPEEVIAR